MSEAALPDYLSDLMNLRAKAEIEQPIAHPEPSPVVHWVPERTDKHWGMCPVIDTDVVERSLLRIRGQRLAEQQANFMTNATKHWNSLAAKP